MKKNRKLTALLVAACMTIPMAATTFTVPMVASGATTEDGESNSITIEDDAYAYQEMHAYQVFAGSYSDAAAALGITGWGDGINAIEFIKNLQSDNTLKNAESKNYFEGIDQASTAETASAVAGKLASLDTTQLETVAKWAVRNKTVTKSGKWDSANNKITNLPDGYYVVVDSSASNADNNTGAAWTLGLFHVAGGTDLDVEPKRIHPTVTKTAKDSDNSYEGSIIDAYKGETVHFKIEVNVPDISRYNNYYLEIVDTLGDNFSVPTSITLKNGNNDILSELTETKNNSNCYFTLNGNDITVQIENAEAYNNSTIYLEYDAELKETAVTGNTAFTNDDQKNKVYLKYLSDPNVEYKPNDANGLETPSPLSETPESIVNVLTYQLEIYKHEEGNENNRLQYAKFRLKDGADDDTANYVKLVADANGNNKITWVGEDDSPTEFETDANGIITIEGLDAGTYYLKEVKAPSGYNILTNDQKIEISVTFGDTATPLSNLEGELNDSDIKIDGDESQGKVRIQVANNKGATLPETGGIGTKIFYILGGTLVIGSGAALVIKKRMGKDEE